MFVRDIMTRPVAHVALDDSLDTIRRVFEERRFHHVIVVHERRLVGIISDRDLLRHVSPFAGTPSERSLDAASLRRRAHQIMTRAVRTIAPVATVEEAARMLLSHGISCLPVVEDGDRCIGIVTTRDLLRSLVPPTAASADAAAA
jgi:acetoin utilization protein AcuB